MLLDFYKMLDSKRRKFGISWREVGRQTGVGSSTFTRLSQGDVCDIETFKKLVQWMGCSADVALNIKKMKNQKVCCPTCHHRTTVFLFTPGCPWGAW